MNPDPKKDVMEPKKPLITVVDSSSSDGDSDEDTDGVDRSVWPPPLKAEVTASKVAAAAAASAAATSRPSVVSVVKPQKFKHFAAVIRHAERGDMVSNYKFVDNEHDPPITPRGILQAKATGNFLNQYFKNNGYKFDKMIIECSPFLRCLMTAGQIAPILDTGYTAGKKIIINYRAGDNLVGEYERPGYIVHNYRTNPIHESEWAKYDYDFKWMKHLNKNYA